MLTGTSSVACNRHADAICNARAVVGRAVYAADGIKNLWTNAAVRAARTASKTSHLLSQAVRDAFISLLVLIKGTDRLIDARTHTTEINIVVVIVSPFIVSSIIVVVQTEIIVSVVVWRHVLAVLIVSTVVVYHAIIVSSVVVVYDAIIVNVVWIVSCVAELLGIV